MEKDQIISRLESDLGLSSGFFESLLKENDWSFIIKLHAFVDAACSELLSYHFKEPNLDSTLSLIELGDVKTGKVVFLEKLGLISKEDKKIIQELSKLRNSFAHNIHDANATIEKKFEQYDKQQKKNFLTAFPVEGAIATRLMSDYHNFKTIPALKDNELIQAIKKKIPDLKLQIWSGVLGMLIHFIEIKGFSDFRQLEKTENI